MWRLLLTLLILAAGPGGLAQDPVLFGKGRLVELRQSLDSRPGIAEAHDEDLFLGAGGDGLIRRHWPGIGGDYGAWESLEIPRYSGELRSIATIPLETGAGIPPDSGPGGGLITDRIVGRSADGSVTIAERGPAWPLQLLRNGMVTAAPVKMPILRSSLSSMISGDGRYLFGLNALSLLVRVDLSSPQQVVEISGYEYKDHLFGVSGDGQTAFLWRRNLPAKVLVWSSGVGFRTNSIPVNFTANSVSGDGMTLVGNMGSYAASLHRTGDTWRLKEFPVLGSLLGASENGEFLLGGLLPAGAHPAGASAIFRPDGRVHSIDELLPGVTLPPESQRQSLVGKAISADGRRAIFLYTPKPSTAQASRWWIADLVYPEDRPKVVVEPAGNGRVRVRFPTQRRLSYQLKRAFSPSSAPGDWVSVGTPRSGDGLEAVHEEDASATGAFYAVDVKPE